PGGDHADCDVQCSLLIWVFLDQAQGGDRIVSGVWADRIRDKSSLSGRVAGARIARPGNAVGRSLVEDEKEGCGMSDECRHDIGNKAYGTGRWRRYSARSTPGKGFSGGSKVGRRHGGERSGSRSGPANEASRSGSSAIAGMTVTIRKICQ